MPKATARTSPGRVTNNREPLSSSTQLAAFGVRLAKFTHRVSADEASDFLSNYDLPSSAAPMAVAINVLTAYDGTTVTATIKAGGTAISGALDAATTGVKYTAATAVASGELSIDFSANDSTEGEVVVTVAYMDVQSMR